MKSDIDEFFRSVAEDLGLKIVDGGRDEDSVREDAEDLEDAEGLSEWTDAELEEMGQAIDLWKALYHEGMTVEEGVECLVAAGLAARGPAELSKHEDNKEGGDLE